MDAKVRAFIEADMLASLSEFPPATIDRFRMVFSHKDRDKPLEEIIRGIPDDNLESAMKLVDRTTAARAARGAKGEK